MSRVGVCELDITSTTRLVDLLLSFAGVYRTLMPLHGELFFWNVLGHKYPGADFKRAAEFS